MLFRRALASWMTEPLVKLVEVHKRYRLGGAFVPALRGVSLEIHRGSLTVIAGPSGSGKTTLLNLMGCLDHPCSGQVLFEGKDVAGMSDAALSGFRARRLGFVFQSFNLVPVLSVLENVEYPLRLNRVPRGERLRRSMQAIEAVGLAEHHRHRPNQLSGGQQQRTAIARALVHQPDLILADEPTANLDSETGLRIVGLMKTMQRERGVTFVLCSHDPLVVAEADVRVTMRDGRLAAPGGAHG
jgi:putative ABC transport system ATP-binding protein